MPNHVLYLLESLLLRALVHHSKKQGITGVLLNNRRLRVLVFSFLHTFFSRHRLPTSTDAHDLGREVRRAAVPATTTSASKVVGVGHARGDSAVSR